MHILDIFYVNTPAWNEEAYLLDLILENLVENPLIKNLILFFCTIE